MLPRYSGCRGCHFCSCVSHACAEAGFGFGFRLVGQVPWGLWRKFALASICPGQTSLNASPQCLRLRFCSLLPLATSVAKATATATATVATTARQCLAGCTSLSCNQQKQQQQQQQQHQRRTAASRGAQQHAYNLQLFALHHCWGQTCLLSPILLIRHKFFVSHSPASGTLPKQSNKMKQFRYQLLAPTNARPA